MIKGSNKQGLNIKWNSKHFFTVEKIKTITFFDKQK